MSWELREYFVVTEYLIKTHFVPLFRGLTMANDLNTVIKKLMDNSSGQENEAYENICVSNHVDYIPNHNIPMEWIPNGTTIREMRQTNPFSKSWINS